MTDRIYALEVLLEEDIRIDDVQPLMDAIKQMRGVQHVEPQIANIVTRMAYIKARDELVDKIKDILWPPLEG
jgi:hypothetical protein